MFFLVKPEYNRTFYRRLKTLKKAIGGHQKPLQRTLEGSATNLGRFAKGPWRVKKYYFYRLPKNVLHIG